MFRRRMAGDVLLFVCFAVMTCYLAESDLVELEEKLLVLALLLGEGGVAHQVGRRAVKLLLHLVEQTFRGGFVLGGVGCVCICV